MDKEIREQLSREVDEMSEIITRETGTRLFSKLICNGELRQTLSADSVALTLLENGFRKADVVAKEVATTILQFLLDANWDVVTEGDYLSFVQGYKTEDVRKTIEEIAKRFGVEI